MEKVGDPLPEATELAIDPGLGEREWVCLNTMLSLNGSYTWDIHESEGGARGVRGTLLVLVITKLQWFNTVRMNCSDLAPCDFQ